MKTLNLTETRVALIQEGQAFAYNNHSWETMCPPVLLDGSAHTMVSVCKNLDDGTLLAIQSSTVVLTGTATTIRDAVEFGCTIGYYLGKVCSIEFAKQFDTFVAMCLVTGLAYDLDGDAPLIM